MKRILILTLAVLFLLDAHRVSAQDTTSYRSIFGDSISSWEGVSYYGFSGTEMEFFVHSNNIHLIDSVEYVKIEGMVFYYANENGRTIYLRESERHDKLYSRMYYYGSFSPEILVMDLSLEVGDTVDMSTWPFLENLSVVPTIRIDSIYYKNGLKRLRTDFVRRISIESYGFYFSDTLEFIEGVGPNMTPAFYLYLENDHYTHVHNDAEIPVVNCHWKDEIMNYHEGYCAGDYFDNLDNDGGCVCIMTTPSVQEAVALAVKVYPNPVHDRATVSGMQERSLIIVHDMYGHPLMQQWTNDETAQVDFGSCPPGVYFVTVETASAKVTTKIVKL